MTQFETAGAGGGCGAAGGVGFNTLTVENDTTMTPGTNVSGKYTETWIRQ